MLESFANSEMNLQHITDLLEQAKKIIDNLLSDNRIMKAQFESEEQAHVWFNHIHQAEQFLKENE